ANGRVPGTLGTERRDVLYGVTISRALPERRLRRVPRIVESCAASSGWLQRDLRAVLRRQAQQVRGVRRWLCREDDARESRRCGGSARRPRDRSRRFALHHRGREGPRLARHVQRQVGPALYLVWQILIGIVAGFLASKIMRGRGFGILVDLLLGSVGSIIGGFLFGGVGLYAAGLVGRLVVATVGAMLLLFLIRRLA